MSKHGGLEVVSSHLQRAASHLDKANEDPSSAQEHIASARAIYDELLQLLPTLQISGKDRVQFVTDLAAIRERLRALGQSV